MSKLIIVESPSKIKTISKILGPDYIIRATFGHIMDLKVDKGNIGVDIAKDFALIYEVLHDKKDKIKSIIDAAKSADEILIASDPDKEGQCIAYHIASQLESLGKPMKRIAFNEITKTAITKAIANPVGFDPFLYSSQQARRAIDRIVGFMVSPYLSNKIGDKLSAGRVQSVTLRMIVDREREIEEFKPETFFNISAVLAKGSEKFVAKYPKRIEKEDVAKQIKEDLSSCKLVITDVVSKETSRKASPPLTTATLLQEGSTKLKFKADRTTKVAQELYEGGYVTYIRTDSTRIAPEAITEVREYLTKEGVKLPDSPNDFKNDDSAQDAHEAIRPTHITDHPSKVALSEDQKKVYELIWRTFVASQMIPCVFDTMKVTIGGGNHLLIAEGKALKEEGWMSILKPFIKAEKDVVLPILSVGEEVVLVPPKIKVEESKTKPAPRYTDASIVAELKRRGIGRPSTYSTIVTRIAVRNYVQTTAQGFIPTDLGKTVSDDLKQFFSFMDYVYTADMEKKLDLIANGKIEYIAMMKEFFEEFKTQFQRAKSSQGMITDILCPKCGDNTVVRRSKYGYFAGCLKYKNGCDGLVGITMEDGKPVVKTSNAPKVVDDVICPECGAGMVARPDGRFGPFYSCSKYPRCYGKRKMPFGKKCPKCNNELYATLFFGKLKLACMGYPNCKYIEELPEGTNLNWTNPEEVVPPTYSKKVEKILKPVKKKDY